MPILQPVHPQRQDEAAIAMLVSMFHGPGPTFFELARQVLSSTERGYDLLAPKFDLTWFRTPDRLI